MKGIDIMKINNKSKDFFTKFQLLEAGDVFSFDGEIYMKTSHNSLSAVSLCDGQLVKMELSEMVNYLENAELVIDN
jgi:hypothetical protein